MTVLSFMRGFKALWVIVATGALAILPAFVALQDSPSETPGMISILRDYRPWGSDAQGTAYQGEPLVTDPNVEGAADSEDHSSEGAAPREEPQGGPVATDGIQTGTEVHGLVAYGETRVPFGALARSGDADLYLRSDNPQMGRLHALTNPRNDNSTTAIPLPPGVQIGPETGSGNSTGGPQTGGDGTPSDYMWKSVAHGKLFVLVPTKAQH